MTQDKNTQALLPCPFCDSAAGEFAWKDHVGCTNKDCGAFGANLSIPQWNRRPTTQPPSLEGAEEELRALLEKTTPAPWRAWRTGNAPLLDGTLVGQSRLLPVPRPYNPHWVGFLNEATAYEWHHTTVMSDEDADFVAAARNHLPALLSALAGMREALDRYRYAIAWTGPERAKMTLHDLQQAVLEAASWAIHDASIPSDEDHGRNLERRTIIASEVAAAIVSAFTPVLVVTLPKKGE